jgi:hypothetical protein
MKLAEDRRFGFGRIQRHLDLTGRICLNGRQYLRAGQM